MGKSPPSYLNNMLWSRRLTLSFIIFTLGSAAVIACLAFVPYTNWESLADRLASDGDARSFTVDAFTRIRRDLVLIGFVFGVAGTSMILVRRRAIATFILVTREFKRVRRQATLPQQLFPPGIEGWTLLVICTFALLARVPYLNQPIRYDEAYGFLYFVDQPWYVLFSSYVAPNNHVLHSALVKFSASLFGNAAWALRAPALVAGLLVVPALYYTARRLYGPGSALLAGALAAASSQLSVYSTNSRGYSLLLLMWLVTLWTGDRLLNRRSSLHWCLWTAAVVVGCFTIPAMLYPVVVCGAWMLASAWLVPNPKYAPVEFTADLTRFTLAALFLTFFCYTPIIMASGLESLVANRFVVPSAEFWSNTDVLPRELWRAWNGGLPLAVQILLGACALYGLIASRRTLRGHPSPIWFLAIVPLLVLAQRPLNLYSRFFLFALPLYYMAAAKGLYDLTVFIGQQARSRSKTEESLVAGGLCLILSIAPLAKSTVYLNDETGTARDAKAVRRHLSSIATEDLCLVPHVLHTETLSYEFAVAQAPPISLVTERCNKLAIVIPVTPGSVNGAFNETLSRHRIILQPYVEPPSLSLVETWHSQWSIVFLYEGEFTLESPTLLAP